MTNGKQTEYLLKSISQRLSSREDCKDLSYTVIIDSNGIHMDPIIYVFPSRHQRKETDKIDIVSYIHQYKMPAAKINELVFGTYGYGLINNEKKRRWRRLDEA